jgi:hypothetical protein
LWEITELLIPGFSSRPRGGGALLEDRLMFTAFVYVRDQRMQLAAVAR